VNIAPSYLLHIHSGLAEEKVSVDGLALKKAFVASKPHSENAPLKIEQPFGIKAYNSYGLGEPSGPGGQRSCGNN